MPHPRNDCRRAVEDLVVVLDQAKSAQAALQAAAATQRAEESVRVSERACQGGKPPAISGCKKALF